MIATIDDGDYRLAVDAARDKVATQQATVDRIGRQIVAQEANVDQAKAQLVSAQAGAKRTQLEFDRQQALAAQKFASQQTLEQAEANRDQAAAAVKSAQAAIDAANANLDVLKAQQQEAARTLDELKTALAKAERDLSFTVIRAPVDGVFGNRAVQTGDYVQSGQRIASLVPLDEVYIDANFKETQLARLQPGQPVSISVDALPGHAIDGTVASVSPASGSVFSLLPPDNATGNFTKIVQRLPVRIGVPADVAAKRCCGPACRSSSASTPSRRRAASRRPRWPARAQSHALTDSGVPMLERTMASAQRLPATTRLAAAPAAQARDPRTDPAAPARRLPRHVLRHVHGDPRHPDRLVVARRDSGRPVGLGRRNPLGADRLSDRRGDRDPAVGLPVARARHPHPVRISAAGFTLASFMCGTSPRSTDDRVARAAGLHRRRHGADRVRLGLSDLPGPRQNGRAAHRPDRDAGADHRPDRRRLSHRRLFLALAVLHQCGARHRGDASRPSRWSTSTSPISRC